MHDHVQKLWHFTGGLKLEPHKEQSTQNHIERLSVPERIVLPVKQHIGEAAEVLVKEGDYVYKGQPIALARSYISAPVHASTSGTVTHLSNEPVPHPSGLSDLCVVIDTDGLDQWFDDLPEPIQDYSTLNPVSLRMRVRECGIVGLGGAAFPSAVKLKQSIDTLILNGVECEPYISCDDMLMREWPENIIKGLKIIRHALENPRCIIAIEEDMPIAMAAMRQALGGDEIEGIRIVSIPAKYPAGGERQLIKILTGKEVPSDGLPVDIGMVCHNVGTANAVYHAVAFGKPLVSRIVTVTGGGVKQPNNLEVLLGTPMVNLITACGGYTEETARLIMGGPMMGFTLHSDQVPVVKATNCILAASHQEVGNPAPAMPCIRCGECVRVCPAQLLPQELYRYAQARDFDRTEEYHLFDCIECGCCAYVCPSNIPLVQYYRFAKNEIGALERHKAAAELARYRYETRKQRLAREERERAERSAKKKALLITQDNNIKDPKKATIKAAVERVKAKKAAH